LKEAIRAYPALLLNKWIYRIFLKSLLKAAMDSSDYHLAEQVQPSPEKMGKAADLNSDKRVIVRSFNHIERTRWSADE
jgi:hypothetical protein